MSLQQIEKTKAQNAEEPQFRDLSITVDGLNVLDIHMPGSSAWSPRFNLVVSGDRGLDENGDRCVYTAAAAVLESLLLGKERSGRFVPHANISRDDLDNDVKRAFELAEQATSALINQPGDIAMACHSLSITVKTVDFDLIEKNVDNTAPAESVEFLLEGSNEAPAQVSTSLGTTTSIMIGDELHVRREFIDEVGKPVVVWVPASMNKDILKIGDINDDALLQSMPDENGVKVWVLRKETVAQPEVTAPESATDEYAEFDGDTSVTYRKRKFGDISIWVPEDKYNEVTSLVDTNQVNLVETVGTSGKEFRYIGK
jgi:hypothetical protein